MTEINYSQRKSKYRLYYMRYETILEGYNNANWISNTKDSKPTNRFIFVIGEVIAS